MLKEPLAERLRTDAAAVLHPGPETSGSEVIPQLLGVLLELNESAVPLVTYDSQGLSPPGQAERQRPYVSVFGHRAAMPFVHDLAVRDHVAWFPDFVQSVKDMVPVTYRRLDDGSLRVVTHTGSYAPGVTRSQVVDSLVAEAWGVAAGGWDRMPVDFWVHVDNPDDVVFGTFVWTRESDVEGFVRAIRASLQAFEETTGRA